MLIQLVFVLAQFGVNCQNPRIRKDFRVVQSEGKWSRIVSAYRQMKYTGRITYYAKLHQDIFSRIHNNLAFYTWHRALLWEFENEIRAIGGQDLTLPYIDWPGEGSSYNGAVDRGVANHPYYYAQQQGQCLTGQIYDSFTLSSVFNSGQCISRRLDQSTLIAGWADMDNAIIGTSSFRQFSDNMQYGLHADVHIRFGGHMATAFSPVDPLFFAHHAFVDLTLNTWQYVHKNWYNMEDEPLAWSNFQINGRTYYHGQVFQMLNQCVRYQRYWPSRTSRQLKKRQEAEAAAGDKAGTKAETAETKTSENPSNVAPVAAETNISDEITPETPKDPEDSNNPTIPKIKELPEVKEVPEIPESPVIDEKEIESYNTELVTHYDQLSTYVNNTEDCQKFIGKFYQDSFIPIDSKASPEMIRQLGLDPIKYNEIVAKRDESRDKLSTYGHFIRKSVKDVIEENKERYGDQFSSGFTLNMVLSIVMMSFQ